MALTTGTTMAIGNIISQTMIEHRHLLDLDWTRTFRFAAFGYFFGVKRRTIEKGKNRSIDRLGTVRSLLVLRTGETLFQRPIKTDQNDVR